MFPDTMYPEIYFWWSAFCLLVAFGMSTERKAKEGLRLSTVLVCVFVELSNVGASLYFLYLGSLG